MTHIYQIDQKQNKFHEHQKRQHYRKGRAMGWLWSSVFWSATMMGFAIAGAYPW